MSSYAFSRPLLTARHALFRQQKAVFSAKCYSLPRNSSTLVTQSCKRPSNAGRWFGVAGGLGLGLATSLFATPVLCEPTSPRPPVTADNPSNLSSETPAGAHPPPPSSSVNVYELSFGTVAGICAGVFIKKGVKAVAFFVGGIFVLLQYFNSASLVRIDWTRAASKFENLFYTTEANGVRRPPTVVSLWRWLVDFLTADFQPRASFLAGLALGIRIG